MARNGSGTFVTPNTFVTDTPIEADEHNENWADAAQEITNSLALDGQSTMTAPIKAANGAVGAPGITFGSDADSGVYRIGADNIGVAVGATKILDVASTGLNVIGTIKQGGLQVVPLLAQGTFAAASEQSFVLTTFTGYRGFRFIFTDVTTSASVSILFRTSTNAGVAYDAGASDYAYVRQVIDSTVGTLVVSKDDANDSAIVAFSTNGANDELSFETTIYATSTAKYKLFKTIGTLVSAGVVSDFSASGSRLTAADVDAVRFLPFSGTMTGSYAVYGIP